jgi:tetratricopeptide (TPR) repeat protein
MSSGIDKMFQHSFVKCGIVFCLGVSGLTASAQVSPKPNTAVHSGTASRPESRFKNVAARAKQASDTSDFERAVRLYQEALRLRPSWPDGWNRLGLSFYQLKRFTEARDAYRRSSQLTPNDGPSWAFLGLCEYELKDYRHAFGDLVQAKGLGVGSDHDLQVIVRYRLALLWITAGEFQLGLKELGWFAQKEEANDDIIQAIGLAVLRIPLFPQDSPPGKHDLIMKAGEAGFAEGAHYVQEARTAYDQLVATYPSEPNVHYAYGRFISNIDPDVALEQYQREIEISPPHVQARIEAGYLCMKKGEFDRALTFARAAEKLDPQNSLTHNLVGRILFEIGKTSEAVPELEQATRLAPNIVDFHMNLARAYQKEGNSKMAAKELAVFKDLDNKRNQTLEVQLQHERETPQQVNPE